MATALDVISLQQAKDHLVIDFNDYDQQIQGLIETAISLVEQYTDYRLYERVETFYATTCSTNIVTYPITVTDVVNEAGDVVTGYKTRNLPLSITLYVPNQSVITADVGYATVGEIPHSLVSAAYKIITYLFENKDVYSVGLPVDVQLLLNQWRRSPTF